MVFVVFVVAIVFTASRLVVTIFPFLRWQMVPLWCPFLKLCG
jgi:hypothetical protein